MEKKIEGVSLPNGKWAFNLSITSVGEILKAIDYFVNGGAVANLPMNGIIQWVKEADAAPRGKGPLCLKCDFEFLGERTPPREVAFLVTFSGKNKVAISFICSSCAKGKSEHELHASLIEIYKAGLNGDHFEIGPTVQGGTRQ